MACSRCGKSVVSPAAPATNNKAAAKPFWPPTPAAKAKAKAIAPPRFAKKPTR